MNIPCEILKPSFISKPNLYKWVEDLGEFVKGVAGLVIGLGTAEHLGVLNNGGSGLLGGLRSINNNAINDRSLCNEIDFRAQGRKL